MLSKKQQERYHRHLIIPDFTSEDQEILINTAVVVIGAGGLGAPVLQYLSAAGIGKIGIVDTDVVSITNLQRQVLYSESDEGKSKAELAADRLTALNSSCKVEIHISWWTESLAEEIIHGYDLIIDCTDNYQSRLTTDTISQKHNLTWIYGAITGWQGQVSVFNYKGSKSYQEAFNISEENIPEVNGPIGVIGVTPAVVGSLQAAEAIKVILDQGQVMADKLLLVSLKTMEFKVMKY